MSSFFTIPKSQKRKRSDIPGSATKKPRTSTSANSTRGGRSSITRGGRSAPSRPPPRDDESISGSESSRSGPAGDEGYESAASDVSDAEPETAAEKRLRLAEEYLEKVRQETAQEQDGEYGFDAEQIDRDLIAERLKEDVAEQKGKLYRFVAGQYGWKEAEDSVRVCREGSEAPVTACAVISGETDQDAFVFTATKDMRILKWRIRGKRERPSEDLTAEDTRKGVAKPELTKSQRRKLRAKRRNNLDGREMNKNVVLVASTKGNHKRKKDNTYDHHVGPILCLATSPSGHLLVSGGADKRIIVWDAVTLAPKRVFTQHRAAVTSLTFRRTTNQMFSGSADRTIKVWSMDELAYVETLFGHQDEVLDVGSLGMERCVSVGGRDRTARVWKVVEETQLVFRGGGSAAEKESKRDRKRGKLEGAEAKADRLDKKEKSALGEGSIDRVALVDDEMFVTGSDNGSICLWSVQKKKPVHTIPLAHGLDPQMTLEEAFPDRIMEHEEVPGPPLPRAITALAVLPYSDVVISGSWDGALRIWRISQDKKRLEIAGVLGGERQLTIGANGLVNGMAKKLIFDEEPPSKGVNEATDKPNEVGALGVAGSVVEAEAEVDGGLNVPVFSRDGISDGDKLRPSAGKEASSSQHEMLTGIVNDLKIHERGARGKETLTIVAAVSRESRLGRWRTFKSRNSVCVFEVRKNNKKPLTNGDAEHADDESE